MSDRGDLIMEFEEINHTVIDALLRVLLSAGKHSPLDVYRVTFTGARGTQQTEHRIPAVFDNPLD